MKVTILKGSHEIGGNCIQLTSGKTTLLLDAGLPLSAESEPVDLSRLSVDALLVSHPHQDHFGLMATLPPGTPVYIGRLARSLIEAPQVFIGGDRYTLDFHDFKAWQPFTIGEFTITPYLVDHSATDAYAFLIEAEGKRLFYSGDLRSHGRKGILFENLVRHPVRDIDLLFLEGTMLHRSNDQFPDETAVEDTIFQTIRQQKNISLRCVRVRTNRYSIPLPPGTVIEARLLADYIELWHQGKRVARHERCYSRLQQILDLEHYLDVLRKKPGALAGSTPLAQWRLAGRWPDSFDRLWQALNTRHGRQQGTRQMIELLSIGASEGWDQLHGAVDQALSLGCQDVAAIRHLMISAQLDRPAVEAIEVGLLARYERPMPVMSGYDQLLREVPA